MGRRRHHLQRGDDAVLRGPVDAEALLELAELALELRADDLTDQSLLDS